MKNLFNKYFKPMNFIFTVGLSLFSSNAFVSQMNSEYQNQIRSFNSNKELKKSPSKIKKTLEDELQKEISCFSLPVDVGQVSSLYGWRKGKFHHGIDIGVKNNASIRAVGRPDVLSAAPGVVSFVGYRGGYGRMIEIKHFAGYETRYAHLKKIFVNEGDSLLANRVIGKMGNSGSVRSSKRGSGIHLHFEILKDGKSIDPRDYFDNYSQLSIDEILYSSPPSENNLVEPSLSLAENMSRPRKSEPKKIVEKKKVEAVKDSDNLNYGVQILAKSKPLSKLKIRKLEKLYKYPLKEHVLRKVGGNKIFYKYSIGEFDNYERALSLRDSLNSKENLGILIYKDNDVKTKWNNF